MKKIKMSLANIIVDSSVQVRDISAYHVARYAEAMRAGAEFPPLKIDSKTKTLVCGHHRYRAYCQAFKMNHKIDVFLYPYQSEMEMLIDAAKDNADHGVPLTSYEKKKIFFKLDDAGISISEIKDIFSVTDRVIDRWSSEYYISKGKRKPLKRGFDILKGKDIRTVVKDDKRVEEVESNIDNIGSGWSIRRHIAEIKMRIKDNVVDWNDEIQNAELVELAKIILKSPANTEVA